MNEALVRHKADLGEEDMEVSRWEREYVDLQVIPSSTRELPSKALTLFSEIIDYGKVKEVLEPGCGIGRNAIYLAGKGCRVTGVDFSLVVLRRLVEAARAANVENKISPCLADLSRRFPFDDSAFDLCVDSYVFCHLTGDEVRDHYWSEVKRVTKPGGLVYCCVFAQDDEYYRVVGIRTSETLDVVMDPNNQIRKRLYTEDGIKNVLQRFFSIRFFLKFQFVDVVLNRRFRRSLYVLLLDR